jgi:hypothetical protein
MVAGPVQARRHASPSPGAEGFFKMNRRSNASIIDRPISVQVALAFADRREIGFPAFSSSPGFHRIRMRQLENDFLALDRHLARGLDPDADRVAVDLHDGDPDIGPQTKALAELPAQDKHVTLLREPYQIEKIGSAVKLMNSHTIRWLAPNCSFHAKAGCEGSERSRGRFRSQPRRVKEHQEADGNLPVVRVGV